MSRAVTATLAVALLVLLASAGGGSRALAAGDMETGIADDAVLLAGGDEAAKAVAEWRRLGVDVARIHARWIAIAPAPNSTSPPEGFNPRDPDDPNYNWGALDGAIARLRDAGIRPMLSITGSGPLWASLAPEHHNPRYRPSPRRFADFVHAVVERYKADVDRYIVWNEPNQPGWLQPQFDCPRPGHCTPASPHIYRELFRAAAAEIRYVDPGSQVLIGALAPRGESAIRRNAKMRPLQFIRGLGCVDERYQRIRTGACAHALPARASGFAYHPHPVLRTPSQVNPEPDEAAIADLPRLEGTLDRTQRAGILQSNSGAPFQLYLTEFGYQTRPPDPFSGVTPSQQAAWLQESYYRAWRDPRVRNITQYEWRDEAVKPSSSGLSRYAGWQSGLRFASGRAKPALGVFPHPFFVDVRPGRVLARFWGQVRPGGAWHVTLSRRTARGWTPVRALGTNPFGYWSAQLPLRQRTTYSFSYETSVAQVVPPAVSDPEAPAPDVLPAAEPRRVLVRSSALTVAPRPLRRG